ncbi:uncharacterized protein LOC143151201 [Ptiloglossa arizonensis]|uniref:uncharacterized protein LOC143151201 n=1 Tax=Ptiloglossa arizonensis TaxID=3350558 RepID=UPI003FA0D217
MEIVETSKGKPLGLYKGYQFRQYRSNNDVVTWLCLNEKTSKCKGRMTTKNGEILKFIEHTCKPDITKCEIKKHMSIARKRAREEILPIAQIYKEEVEKLFNKGQQFIADVPLYSSDDGTFGSHMTKGTRTDNKISSFVLYSKRSL